MELTIFLILIGICAFFLVLGIWNNSSISMLVGGLLILILGIFLLVDGIAYKTGVTITESNGVTLVNNYYTSFHGDRLANGLSFMLFFVGLYFCVLSVWRIINTGRDEVGSGGYYEEE